MKTKLHYVFSLAIVLIGFSAFAQKNVWQKSTSNGSLNAISISDLNEKNYEIFKMDFNAFQQALANAPLRGENTQGSQTIISVPNAQGQLESFRVFEAPVFDEELSAEYPEIKSYVGFSTLNDGTRLRMSVAPNNVETMISYVDKPTVFMQPVTGDADNYIVYNRLARGNYTEDFKCNVREEFSKTTKNLDNSVLTARDANDQLLRKFRLVVSVTGEYTQYFGGTKPQALAAINASITRVNEVYETDMAINFIVSALSNNVIYTNPNTDPYSPANVGANGAWNGELQNTLNTNIGNANYDIGHLFGRSGGGGNAGCIGCVCVANQKGSGFTSPADGIPQGDTFDIDYVAHEIGHQMGATHTFANNPEGSGTNSEPGSGSTIMGYAGITGPDDVQAHSDPYFHYHSIKQITDNLLTRTCWQSNSPVTITNNPPNANAGADYHIPPGTAYVLKGAATDPDGGDTLMYCWEQTDSGPVVDHNTFGPNLTTGPMNRSLSPTTSPDRYIPKYSRVVAGQLTQTNPTINSAWETVSNVARTMDWALTVRDRQPTATGLSGQSSYDLMRITVEDVPAFTIPGLPNWAPGSSQTVYWNVGQTNNASINCQFVNIKFSTDGGATFPTVLASNTPNDGSQVVNVPSIANTNNARILVEAADNIFYALSPKFNINSTQDFVLNSANASQTICSETSVTYNMNFIASNGFSQNTTFSVTGNPAGSSVVITPTNLSSSGTFTVQINNLGAVSPGDYNLTVTGTSTSLTKNTTLALGVSDGACPSSGTTQYQTGTTGVVFNTISNLNNGKPSGYSDYKSLSTDVNKNSTYPLTVYVNTDGPYQTGTIVWIDWNQNCQFEDATEGYSLGVGNSTSNGQPSGSPLNITVPSDAVLGTTVMRISTEFGAYPTACNAGFDGEVEDYSVNVLAPLSVGDNEFEGFSIFPNPNSGEFTIKLKSTTGNNIKVNVYDVRGRLIFNNLFDNAPEFNQTINLSNVQSGMYLVNVSDGLRQVTKKIIVE
ncbi:MAG: zinc-dependent metalloprotease family protein [Gelidibacter sp.]